MASRESLERAISTELPLLYRVARRMAANSDDAEDLVSQTLLKAVAGWASFDGRHARSWLLKVMRNEFLATLRMRKSRVQTAELDENSAVIEQPFDHLADRALAAQIDRELKNIPEEFAWAVALCDVEGLAYEEAAETLHVPVGTLKSRLHRGRNLLRKRIAFEGLM